MNDLPVIDISRSLRWYRRLSTSGLTLGLWSAWALLWRPVFAAMRPLAGVRSIWPVMAAGQGVGMTGHALSSATITLLGTSGVLLFWQLLAPRGRARGRVAPADGGDGLPAGDLETARHSRIVVVSHAEDGSIESIAARG